MSGLKVVHVLTEVGSNSERDDVVGRVCTWLTTQPADV
jgi:hypothetical protein